jgi:hypothetical protein
MLQATSVLGWWNGRHWRLKISWEQSRAGSIPVPSNKQPGFARFFYARKASQEFGSRQAIEVKRSVGREPVGNPDFCSVVILNEKRGIDA